MQVRKRIQSHFFRYLTVVMIVCLLLFPVLEHFHVGLAALSLVDITAVLLAIRMANHSRYMRVPILGLAVLAVVLDIWELGTSQKEMAILSSLYFCFFYLFAIYSMLKYVLAAGEITIEKLFASIAVYMTMALLFALIYRIIFQMNPEAFVFANAPKGETSLFFEFIYFSFTTITTTGYGDVSPASHQAQAFAVVQQMIGVLYVAVLVARLTNLYSTSSPRDDDDI